MNFNLNEAQVLIVDTVRSFVENEMYPHEDDIERTGMVPEQLAMDIKQKCIELGFYAANLPEAVGGGGLNHLDFTLLERELGRASMALSVYFGRPSGILLACDEAQKQR